MKHNIFIYIFALLTLISMCLSPAYAEIVINDDKTIEVSSDTVFKIDDDIVTETEFEQEAEGHIATVIVTDDSSSAAEVSAQNPVKGPVTSLDPFQVFGQDVVIDAATVLANNNGTFSLGDLLEVSGSFNTSGVVLASRVELKTTLTSWKLMGHVQQVAATVLNIGQVSFDTAGVTLDDCGVAFTTGDLVKIKLNPIADFSTANAITSTDITKFECKNSVVDLPDDSVSNLEFEIEGFVSEIIDGDNFKLNGQQVMVSSATTYFNGTQADIVLGVKLEAEGTLDTTTNILNAAKIKFKNVKVRIEGPVAVNDLDSNQVTIMGVTGLITAFTEDDDDLIATGLLAATNIEARGYVDSAGTFYVEEFRDRGDADATDTRLRGPVAGLNQQLFTILGIKVDPANSTFFIEDQPVDNATFFAALSDGDIVDINHGSYDEQTNTLFNGEVTIELEDDSSSLASISSVTKKKATISAVFATSSVIFGTVTGFAPAAAPTPAPAPAPAPAPSSGGGGTTGLFFMLLLSLGLKRKRS